MAHTKSARKRIRQDRKRRLRNQMVKTRLRTLSKTAHATLEGDSPEGSAALVKEYSRQLDKAASKGIIHRRTASRKAGRIARAAHRRSTPAASA